MKFSGIFTQSAMENKYVAKGRYIEKAMTQNVMTPDNINRLLFRGD